MNSEAEFTALSRDDLIARWEEVIGRPPPPRIAKVSMARIIVCETQWQSCGQSRATLIKKLKKVAAAAETRKPVASSGARLIREWNGREYVVDVTDNGYTWNGKPWRSLSAIAREITGTKWSGPRFFGVAA